MREDDSSRQRRFRRSFDSYSRLVYSVAYSFMKNRDEADDVMQEVFLKYYQHMDGLTDDEGLKPWLVTVTANTCRNILRSGWFSRTILGETESTAAYDEDFGESSDLFDAVMDLPEKERVPLHLFYYEGCSVREVARLLGMKEATVRVRIMRGREKLKKLLKEETV